jgi:5-methylcytosine-specific restriction protein A
MSARPSDPRPSAASRGYDARWRKARLAYLRAHPLCECAECEADGRLLPATVVDHRTPHRGNEALFWDESNWMAMSSACHNRKTAAEDGGLGHVPGPQEPKR